MPARAVVPFTSEHVARAASVLERRHQLHRAATPFLSEVASFADQVTTALEGASGSVARKGDEVVG